MKMKKYKYTVDALNIILLYILVVAVFALLDFFTHMRMSVFEYAMYFGAITLFYFIREFITKLYLYIVFCAGITVTAVYIALLPAGYNPMVFFFCAFLVAATIVNIYYWMNARSENVPDVSFGATLILVIIAAVRLYKHDSAGAVFVYYQMIAFIIISMVKKVIYNTGELMQSGQVSSDAPIKEMLRNNYLAAGIIIFMCLLATLFIKADRFVLILGYLAERLGKYIVAFLRSLSFGEDSFVPPVKEPLDLNALPFETTEPALWLEYFYKFLEAILFLSAAAVVVFLLVKALITLIKEYGRRASKPYKTKEIVIKNEVREKLEKEHKTRRKSLFLARTKAEKIRQLYKKKLLSIIKGGIRLDTRHTPRENSKIVKSSMNIDIGRATSIYEKVRYDASYIASDEDVSTVKEIFR